MAYQTIEDLLEDDKNVEAVAKSLEALSIICYYDGLSEAMQDRVNELNLASIISDTILSSMVENT